MDRKKFITSMSLLVLSTPGFEYKIIINDRTIGTRRVLVVAPKSLVEMVRTKESNCHDGRRTFVFDV